MTKPEVKPLDLQELIPAKDAALDLCIHYNTLLRRVQRGKIKAIKHGWSVFIPKSEIERVKGESV